MNKLIWKSHSLKPTLKFELLSFLATLALNAMQFLELTRCGLIFEKEKFMVTLCLHYFKNVPILYRKFQKFAEAISSLFSILADNSLIFFCKKLRKFSVSIYSICKVLLCCKQCEKIAAANLRIAPDSNQLFF